MVEFFASVSDVFLESEASEERKRRSFYVRTFLWFAEKRTHFL